MRSSRYKSAEGPTTFYTDSLDSPYSSLQLLSQAIGKLPIPRRGRARFIFRLTRPLGILSMALLFLTTAISVEAEIPTVLTDKVHKGSGVIDLMTDVSGAALGDYIDGNGSLLLGIDLNENAVGNESSTSVGIAIKEFELVLTTTEGVLSFNEFYTSTTAMILEQGASESQEFYTLFGSSGSNNINGGTSGFDISAFDDVITLDNISYTGEILDAQLNVAFLDTADTGIEGNETFFDYSNGFEDFALLTEQDAQLLETANIGVAEASETIAFTDTAAPPAAPLPPWQALTALGFLFAFTLRRSNNRA